MIASQSRSAEITELLCRQRVDLNQQIMPSGQSAIWAASHHGSLDVVKVLLHFGANVNLADNVLCLFFFSRVFVCVLNLCLFFVQDGVTPIWIASQDGHEKVLKLLHENGADPTAMDVCSVFSHSISLAVNLELFCVHFRIRIILHYLWHVKEVT